MAQVTGDMIASIIEYADKGERYPLTVNELRQLAYMAKAARSPHQTEERETGCPSAGEKPSLKTATLTM